MKRKEMLVPLVVLASASIVYVAKLFLYAPWYGADTYPLYPKTLEDVASSLLSSWNFHSGRTAIGFGIQYVRAAQYVAGTLLGRWAEVAFAVWWLLIGSLGFYFLARRLGAGMYTALLGALAFLSSIITWHEVVNSVYGMLGAYAVTPWLLLLLISSISSGFKKSMLAGLVAGLISAPILTPYYAVFTLFLWAPFTFAISLRRRFRRTTMLSSLLFLLGFLFAYVLPLLETTITSSELHGIRGLHALAGVKLEDFEYNYARVSCLAPWLVYPWSALGAKYSLIYPFIAAIVAILVFSSVRTLNSTISLIWITGFLATVGFVEVAHAAATTGMVRLLWTIPFVPLFLSALSQPIKVGLAIPIYFSLAISSLHDKKHITIVSAFVVACFVAYAVALPISPSNRVSNLYDKAMFAVSALRDNSPYTFAYNPFVVVSPRGDLLKNYRTYADNAMRPLIPYGVYIHGVSFSEGSVFELLSAGNLSSYVAAKTLYVGAYIRPNGSVILEKFRTSPVYIVIPIGLEPFNMKSYIQALLAISRIIGINTTLAYKYLDSPYVIDFVPASYNGAVAILNYTNGVLGVYINGSKTDIKMVARIISSYIQDNESFRISASAVLPKVYVTSNREIMIRLNELYSPYWICSKGKRIDSLLFNIYNINAGIHIIIHRFWMLRLLETFSALAMLVIGLYSIKRMGS